MKSYGSLLPGIALLCGVASPSPAAADPPALEAVDDVLRLYVDRGQVAGAVALVWQAGRVVHERAYGRRSLGEADEMRADDLFRVASMTKPVVAVGALILVDRGLISLDDPVEKYLPEWQARAVYVAGGPDRPTEASVTVRQLLSHTGGIGGHFEGTPVERMYLQDGGLDRSSLGGFSRSLARHPLVAEPGSRWIYSYSFEVVGRLIEVVSGEPLDRYLSMEIFDPLGMTSTGFTVAPSALDRLVGVQRWNGHELAAVDLSEQPTMRPGLTSASGGLYSTVPDFLRFARMLLGGGQLDGRRIVSEAAVREMTRDQMGAIRDLRIGPIAMPGQRFGLGVAIIEDPPAAGHGGGRGAFYWAGSLNTVFLVDPEWDAILLLFAQYEPFLGLPVEVEFRRAVFASLERPASAEAP